MASITKIINEIIFTTPLLDEKVCKGLSCQL